MTGIPYCGPAPAPGAILSAWNLDPLLLVALGALAWLLRGETRQVHWGLATLFLAYVSPICALSAGLFAARSLHHLLIVFAAAPLLAGLFRSVRVPLSLALLLSVFVFWAWHVPGVYQAVLSSDAAYWLGQIALLGSSALFWSGLFRRETSGPPAFFALIALVMQMGLLGAIITFAPQALYTPHLLTTQQYGFSPLEDQQLAGLIMWVGSLPLTVLAGWAVLARLFRRIGREATA